MEKLNHQNICKISIVIQNFSTPIQNEVIFFLYLILMSSHLFDVYDLLKFKLHIFPNQVSTKLPIFFMLKLINFLIHLF